ncbi:MAG: hypothetical protein AB7O96_06840 [Pseudobdellovibrionaceae bacterium]
MRFLILLLVTTFSAQAFAYLPQPRLILFRTVEKHGSGSYQIESLVEISSPQGSKTFRETWWIENDSTLSVLVKGENPAGTPIEFLISYDSDGKTVFTDRLQKEGTPPEFFEKFWLSRSINNLGRMIIQHKMAPNTLLQRRPAPKNLNEPTYNIESYLKLGRLEGVINWVFSTGENEPGIWIEQDEFVIRKLRFGKNSEVRAIKFSGYARGLEYPKSRVVKWGDNQATLTTVSVSSLNASQFASKVRKAPDSNSRISPLQTYAESNPAVVEFYSRFR